MNKLNVKYNTNYSEKVIKLIEEGGTYEIKAAELGEMMSIPVCKKYFGENFIFPSRDNECGFDIMNEDGTILVEVKTVASTNGTSSQLLISNFKNKRNNCTHFILIDLYSDEERVSLLTHDQFFNEFEFKRKDKSAITWNSSYKNGSNMNHLIFEKYEIKL